MITGNGTQCMYSLELSTSNLAGGITVSVSKSSDPGELSRSSDGGGFVIAIRSFHLTFNSFRRSTEHVLELSGSSKWWF